MRSIQIIEHDGRAAAVIAGGQAIIAERLTGRALRHVQAKALFALEIETGSRAGPYDDHAADYYARETTTGRAAAPARHSGAAGGHSADTDLLKTRGR